MLTISVIGSKWAPFTLGAAVSLVVLLASDRWRYGSWSDIGYTTVDTSYPPLEGTFNLFFSSGKSVFLFAPIVAVAVVGLCVHSRSIDRLLITVIAVIAVNTVTVARLTVWSGDDTWGPRYMQVVLPLLVALAAPVVDRVPWRHAVRIAGVLGLAVPALLGVLIASDVYFIDVAQQSGRPDLGAPLIHFDWSYNQMFGHAQLLPAAMGELYASDRPPYSSSPSTF